MSGGPAQAHWDSVYTTRAEAERSWTEPDPAVSLEMLEAAGIHPNDAIVDVGAGASRLIDGLLNRGYSDLTALDLCRTALEQAAARLGARAAEICWVAADVMTWRPERQYRLWHDRALFHFFTAAEARRAYCETLERAVMPGGGVILATFAEDGPERCSGLPVCRYSARALAQELGCGFSLADSRRVEHCTPWGSVQPFQYCRFTRV